MSDAPQDLRQQLRTANAARLAELVEENGSRLGLAEVRQVLLNPFAGAEVLELLATNRKLMSERTLRAAVTGHHRTPPAIAMRFVAGLFWRELLEISLDVRVAAAVRRSAENYLVQRLTRLTVGEKAALARRCTPRLARELVLEPTLRVLDALLENSRLTARDLMPLLTSDRGLPRSLERVARNDRWGAPYEVRLALCRNPRTPSRDVVRLLPSLLREDLEGVAEKEEHGWLVRHRAQQILDDWPRDLYRERVAAIAREEDRRIELDASPRPGDAALLDAIDSAPS